ncbi:MAG: MFS transporter, partial [Stackebrandtia sp.]
TLHSSPMRLPLRYVAGSFLARFAEEGMGVTMALLAVQRTGSVGHAAALSAAWLAPHVVAAPFIGTLASRARHPSRYYAFGLVVVAVGIAASTLLLGRVPLIVVCAIAAAGGCFGPVVSGGLSSLVAELLPEGHRDRAYSWDSATYNAAAIAGTAVAAAIAATLGGEWSGWMLAAAAVIAAVLIALLPIAGSTELSVHEAVSVGRLSKGEAGPGGRSAEPSEGAATAPGLLSDLLTGVKALWQQRTLRAVTAATCLAYLGIGGLTITAVTAGRQWGGGEFGGVLVAVFAAGALTGALALTKWTPRISPQRLAAYSLLVTGVSLGLAAIAPNFGVGLVLFAIAGAGDGPLLSATLRVRAAHAPAGVRAQVFTTGAALKLSAAAVGAALAGVMETLPAGVPLVLIAVTQLAACAVVWLLAPASDRAMVANPAG